MILSGQWIFKENQSIFLLIIYKLNIAWIYLFIIEIHSTIVPTVAVRWQCKSNVIEMIIHYLRLIGCCSITLILKSKKRENIIALIRNYELKYYQNESEAIKKIYFKYSYVMNLIIKISVVGGIFAVTNVYVTGVR